LKGVVRPDGSVTAGNASGVNDGACAVLLASAGCGEAVRPHAAARILGAAAAGVPPRIMGIGPAPATEKLLARLGLALDRFDVIELNEAFAAQALAVTRRLGLADDDMRVNPNGGAIAIGHPLGASGARLVTTAVNHLEHSGGRLGLATMCIGVGQASPWPWNGSERERERPCDRSPADHQGRTLRHRRGALQPALPGARHARPRRAGGLPAAARHLRLHRVLPGSLAPPQGERLPVRRGTRPQPRGRRADRRTGTGA